MGTLESTACGLGGLVGVFGLATVGLAAAWELRLSARQWDEAAGELAYDVLVGFPIRALKLTVGIACLWAASVLTLALATGRALRDGRGMGRSVWAAAREAVDLWWGPCGVPAPIPVALPAAAPAALPLPVAERLAGPDWARLLDPARTGGEEFYAWLEESTPEALPVRAPHALWAERSTVRAAAVPVAAPVASDAIWERPGVISGLYPPALVEPAAAGRLSRTFLASLAEATRDDQAQRDERAGPVCPATPPHVTPAAAGYVHVREPRRPVFRGAKLRQLRDAFDGMPGNGPGKPRDERSPSGPSGESTPAPDASRAILDVPDWAREPIPAVPVPAPEAGPGLFPVPSPLYPSPLYRRRKDARKASGWGWTKLTGKPRPGETYGVGSGRDKILWTCPAPAVA
jgi:hypothetical protein